MITAYYNCIILSDGLAQRGKAVLIEGQKILDIVDEGVIPMEASRVDLQGAYLAPGLIDLQIYGISGKLFGGKPTVDALEQMELDLLKQGTTGFFATVATNSDDIVRQAIESAKVYRKKAKGSFLGLHLEGPYLNPVRKGAHPEEYIKKGSLPQLKKWVEDAEGELRMMTIAPELQDQEVIDYLTKHGVIISCGHSNANYDEAMAFLNNPVPAATHLFNAMPPIHHREPGLIAAIFETKPFASIIADGVHVSYVMLRMAKQLLHDKLFLITDAVTDTKEGMYQHVFRGDRYTMPDGTLSGSSLSMLRSVQNCVEHAGIPLAEAVNMASLYPATLIKAANQKGRIEPGYTADFIVFDKNYVIKEVSLNGTIQNK